MRRSLIRAALVATVTLISGGLLGGEAHGAPVPVFVRTDRNAIQDIGLGGTEYTTTFVVALAYQANVSAGPDNTAVAEGALDRSRVQPVLKPVDAEQFSVLSSLRLWSGGVPAFVPSNHSGIVPSLPWVIEEIHFRITVAIALDLQDFPFDTHWVATKLRMEVPPASIAELVSTFASAPIAFVDPAWDLRETQVDSRNATNEVLRQEFSELSVAMKLRRRTGYYRNKILSVMCALVVMGWLLFFLDMRDGRRVQCISVLFLSLVAFNQSAQSSLPRVSYLTRLDIFTIFAIANQFVVFTLMNAHVLGETMVARAEQRLIKERDQRDRERERRIAAKQPLPSAREPVAAIDPAWRSAGPFARQSGDADLIDDDGPIDIVEVEASELPEWMAWWAANRFFINYGSMAFAVAFFVVTA
eukprot:CAMPEP_0174837086 /NCGR_PEP_ID=MMETSP1114-20130205/6500_1 /TAXON_ID=312471 /ORGANISM="Neobodo designis, Strain CCAP 1951/1" /LENGTH=414 /DNA_ID=CAMNT_0016071131 /DNA_START=46 /DNA_END=1286 /DNA_ORIENTATION=+